jgi:hypothetical protein
MFGAKVIVTAFVATTDVPPDAPSGEWTEEKLEEFQYGWFRLTDRIQYADRSARYIAAAYVSGCDQLTQPFEFNESELISGNLDTYLPVPPEEYLGPNAPELRCTEYGQQIARTECAFKVYVDFYRAITNPDGYNRRPTVRDVLAFFMETELAATNTEAPTELLRATALNVYAGVCVFSSTRSSCTGADLMYLLSTSDYWVQSGSKDPSDPETVLGKLDIFLSEETQQNIDLLVPSGNISGLVVYAEESPLFWGNNYYGTEAYTVIVGGEKPTMYCEVLYLNDSLGNYAYSFYIVSAEDKAEYGPYPETNYRSSIPVGTTPPVFPPPIKLGEILTCSPDLVP